LSPEKTGGRALRRKIAALLKAEDFPENLHKIRELSPRITLHPLLGFLCSTDPDLKQRAVTALGFQTAELAAEDLEAARNIMRRLMWSLNDESGSIGWGAPEAMAEIMARHEGLAGEYAAILVSYMRTDGNYLEHIPLQRDLLRGMGRLASVTPRLLLEWGADRFLTPYLESSDAEVRGLAARCAGLLRARNTRKALQKLLKDPAEITVFHQGCSLTRIRVGDLAGQALTALDAPSPQGPAGNG